MHVAHEAEPAADTMFTFRRVGQVGVVTLVCPALRERQASLLTNYLADLADRLRGKLVLEVSGVRSFSCAWINAMIELSRRCVGHGGELMIVGLSAPARKLMNRTGLLAHLRVERSQAVALRLLGAPVLDPWRLTVARWLGVQVATESPRARAA